MSTMQQEFKNCNVHKHSIPISVDFDATICKPHAYPYIVEENPLAIETLKKWQDMGCMIMLNTMRGGVELEEAIQWCKERGLEFDAIGRNPTQDQWCREGVYKIYSVLDIDDRNAGCPMTGEEVDGRGWVDWKVIDEIYTPKIKQWVSEE